MRKYKIVLFILIGVALVAVAGVTALMFVDPSVFRNQLETRASKAFGREFRIAGPIQLERSLRPQIILEDISIANPEWATGEYFATGEKVVVQVALFPLLRGNLRVLDVVFSGIDLFIEEGPDGANNYTFGDGSESQTPGALPPVERLLVNDSIINFRAVDGSSKRFEISEARLWNIPAEPERIEARGATKGMTFNILLAADNAAELTSPQNPWSLKLDIDGPNMSLTLAGQMEQAFKWNQGNYRIKLSGNQADSLEKLFDLDLPTSGPFELSANVNKTERSFRVTDIAARLQGPQTSAIKISGGEASGGQDDPVQLALQGQFGETPFTLRFASTQPYAGISQKTPWPIEAGLTLADLKLNIEGEIIPATAAERLEFDVHLQGENLDMLAQFLNTELPDLGPYQLKFHTKFAAGKITFDALEGTIERAGLFQKVQIMGGEVSVLKEGAVEASLDTRLDKVPLSLAFEGGPWASAEAGRKTWPIELQASASGARLTGSGNVVSAENENFLQMAARISGNRLESLAPLVGDSLPAIGKFDLRADVTSDGDVHEARNLQIQIRNHQMAGNVRLEDKKPRSLLTGKLFTKRLAVSEFEALSTSSSKGRSTGLLDRPINLDGLKAFDARLDLAVKNVVDSPISVTDINSTIRLTNGELNAPFRASITGTLVKGEIELRQRNDVAYVSLNTTSSKIDVGQILKQLKIADAVVGTAKAVNLTGKSTGKTLGALLKEATFVLQLKPADLSYPFEITNQKFEFWIESAEIAAGKNRPLKGTFSGTLQGSPFNAEITSSNLTQLRDAGSPLPLQMSIQSRDIQLKAQGSIGRPFEKNEFEIAYELSGSEIRGLDPLADYVLPLRGEFNTRGRLTAHGNRFTYTEDLQVGKSDFKLDVTVLQKAPRPKINGSILSTQIHMDDIQLIEMDPEGTPGREKSRVIPDYTLPVDQLFAVDADIDIKAERIRTQLGDLGEFVSKIGLKDGRLLYSLRVAGYTGGQLNGEIEINAAEDPPRTMVQLKAEDLNFGFLLSSIDVTDYLEGRGDLIVDLSGYGATRYRFLENIEGRIAIIGGPGRISGRRIDLWAADLIPTMLSSQWQRENVTQTNCIVAHIEVNEGRAEIEDLLLDTQRITIAASGTLNLENEDLDVIVAPRPKRASLVSLANPVRIEGTLAEPEVSVTRIPRGRRLAGTGLLAGLVNPAFLVFALSDRGTGDANPCAAVVEDVRENIGLESP